MVGMLIVGGYLLGSIPVAWLIAKGVTGKDLRQMGSGNVGVLNTAISVARWAGLLVFLAEATKGTLAVVLARALGGDEIAIGLTVLATVIGTRWSIWLRGAGGRGNTVGITAILILSWPTLVISEAIWVLACLLTKRSFVATRIMLVVWPCVFGLITQSWHYLLFGAALSLIYATTHRPETDDHLLIKDHWPSLWAFLTSGRR